MNLQPIVKFLDDEGFGVMGEDLFRDFMPHEIDKGLMIFIMSPVPIDPYLGTSKGSFQIVGRGNDQDELQERMEGVQNAFGEGRGLVLGSMEFDFIIPQHEPLVFPRTEGDLIEASVSFAFSYHQQT